MSDTKISWTNRTWNPVTGCSRVSEGCDHCYAFALHDQRFAAQDRAATAALRNAGVEPFKGPTGRIALARAQGLALPLPRQYDKPFSFVQLHSDRLEAPLHWKKPARVFVNSMSDLFHEDVPDLFILDVFQAMAATPQHTFQVLTKRPERMRDFCSRISYITPADLPHLDRPSCSYWPNDPKDTKPRPLPNVWLGVSAENQRWADQRIPILLNTPAAVRFVSLEPLLGLIRLWPSWLATINPMHENELDWVIVGAESGPHRRPFEWEWARDLLRQCREAGVAYFFKQGSGRYSENLDGVPDDLRVREYPA